MDGESGKQALRIVGVDIGGTKVAAAFMLCDGASVPRIISRSERLVHADEGREVILLNVEQVIKDVAADSGFDIQGIGVGTAGCVSPTDGVILSSSSLMVGWAGTNLQLRLHQTFGVPVSVIGDVQSHALGETRWGAAKGCSSCLMVAPGTGLGGAIVVDGKVLRGAHGIAGHIGHTLHPAASGIKCSCGKSDHVEPIVSGVGIGSLYQEKNFDDPAFDPALDGAEVSRRGAAGEQKAQDVLRKSGFALGQAIGSWANIIDPELIILSGSVCKSGAIWRDAVTEGFATQVLDPLRDIPIVSAALGSDAPLIGAAYALLEDPAFENGAALTGQV